MDDLPHLCLELIYNNLIKTSHGNLEKEYKLSNHAAKYALVGNKMFTKLAELLWEIIEPNCKQVAIKKLQKCHLEWQEFKNNYQSYLDKIPKLKLHNLTAQSKVKELKTALLEFNITKSGKRKAEYWEMLESAVNQSNKSIKDLEYIRDTPPTLSKCWLSKRKINEITRYKQIKISISKARKDYLLTDKELNQLPCDNKLYSLPDIEELVLNKYKSIEEFDEAIKKRNYFSNMQKELKQQAKFLKITEIDNLLGQDNLENLLSISDKSVQYYNNYINNGGNKSELQSCMNKYLELENAGVFRDDSKLCLKYIETNLVTLDYVINTMLEMRFLYTHTKYEYYREEIFYELPYNIRHYVNVSEEAKERAIKNLKNPLSYPDLPLRFKQWIK
jgi:hypothetical protein